MLTSLRTSRRLQFVDGDPREIIPGSRSTRAASSPIQSQHAGVRTVDGTVVIASDNMSLYENLDRQLLIAQTLDAASNVAAQRLMTLIATSPRRIVPGHDPVVLTRFKAVMPGVVWIR